MANPKRKFTEEQRMSAVKLLVEGMSSKEVARMFDVKVQTVNVWRRELKDRVIVPDTSIEHRLVLASDEIEDAHRSMTINAIDKTDKIVSILYDRITDPERDLSVDQITRALTAINNCIKTAHKESGNGGANTQQAYYNHIESLIIQNNDNNPNFLKHE